MNPGTEHGVAACSTSDWSGPSAPSDTPQPAMSDAQIAKHSHLDFMRDIGILLFDAGGSGSREYTQGLGWNAGSSDCAATL
jgi:hypothetical protein